MKLSFKSSVFAQNGVTTDAVVVAVDVFAVAFDGLDRGLSCLGSMVQIERVESDVATKGQIQTLSRSSGVDQLLYYLVSPSTASSQSGRLSDTYAYSVSSRYTICLN